MNSGKVPMTVQPRRRSQRATTGPGIEQRAERQDDAEQRQHDHRRLAADEVGDPGRNEPGDRRRHAERAEQHAQRRSVEAAHLREKQRQEREADHQVRDHHDRDQHAQQDVSSARAPAPATYARARGCQRLAAGSRISHAISSALSTPGTAARKNALRQPKCAANGSSTSEAAVEPSRFEPKFCMKPIASPRRCGRNLHHGERLADRQHAAFGDAHEQPHAEQRDERADDARQARAHREHQRGADQDRLARAGAVGEIADHDAGDRPGQRERRSEQPDLRVRQAQVRLHERHQEVERVAIEEQDAEVQAQQPDQQAW